MCKKIFLICTSFDFFYMQTSKAFEILDSQLSIIFSMSNLFIGEVSSQILSGDQQLQISHHKREGSQIVEDNEETNSIDFVSLLQKFKDVQRQHQEHVIRNMWQLRCIPLVPLNPSCPKFYQLHKCDPTAVYKKSEKLIMLHLVQSQAILIQHHWERPSAS